MSDKIEVKVGREYLERPIMDIVEVIQTKIKEKYPGYNLAWLEASVPREVVEEEVKSIGAKNAKVIELDVNVLPFRHYGVLMPEGEPLLAAP